MLPPLPPASRSSWSRVLLSGVVSATLVGWSGTAGAQTAPAAAPQATPAAAAAPVAAPTAAPALPADKKLTDMAEDFMHYSLVNNVELAKANGEALLAAPGAKPEEVLKAFEDSANGRPWREVLLQDQRRDDLKDIATRLLDRVDEGFRNVARDPVRIRAEVDRLSSGPRGYENAKARLTAAGQFAMPILLEYLQNAAKRDLHPYIIRVMGEIGRPILTPLIEELRVSDPTLRIELINVAGQIGYPQALPALRALQSDSSTSPEMKSAVDNAIHQIDRTGMAEKMSPAELYLRGGQNYYDKKASYQPLQADEKTNPIWIFDPGLNNVTALTVPTPIWNSVMAVRMAESALKLDANNSEAISLWLAANARREIQLPAGATDPTRAAGTPDASFYLRAAGPVYVNPVLGKALDAHDSALALRAVDALEATGGVSGLVSNADSPLVRALSHPDRSVRFRAAFALARANPATQFASFYRVVPILAEAVSSTGSPTALVVVEADDQRNALGDALRSSEAHFAVYSGASLSAALEQGQRAPAFDVVVVSDGPEMARIADIARTDYRLTGIPVLVTTKTASVQDVQARLSDMKGYRAIDEKADAAAVAAALAQARADAGAVPLSPENATQFASTALDLLGALAADHRSIFPVTEALPALIDALKDKRPEIATAAARVIGELNSPDGERALAAAALAAETDAALRVTFFQQLAESAKHTGNALDASAINGIIKAVSSNPDAKARVAAATALGALNVPSNQASTLILQQSK